MSAGFATIEARLNARALSRLCNRMVSIGGGQPTQAIFDRAHEDALEMSGPAPILRLSTAACANVVEGVTTVPVDATTYTIARHEPDGTGVSILRLRQG